MFRQILGPEYMIRTIVNSARYLATEPIDNHSHNYYCTNWAKDFHNPSNIPIASLNYQLRASFTKPLPRSLKLLPRELCHKSWIIGNLHIFQRISDNVLSLLCDSFAHRNRC